MAAGLLAPGTTAVVLGGDGVLEALAARGVTVVPEGPADAVVVGLTRAFTYDALTIAVTAVRNGARLIGTNEDATYPTPDGLVPGAGAILAAVTTASGVTRRGGGQAPPARPPTPSSPGVPVRRPPGHGGGPPLHRRRPGRPAGHSLRRWSSPGSPRRGRSPPTPTPRPRRPTSSRLVQQALDGTGTAPDAMKVLAAS